MEPFGLFCINDSTHYKIEISLHSYISQTGSYYFFSYFYPTEGTYSNCNENYQFLADEKGKFWIFQSKVIYLQILWESTRVFR